MKRVCRKRVNESSQQLNPCGDDSVVGSSVLAVESISMDSPREDFIVPITPSSKEGVDPFLGLNDSPSPIGVQNRELIDWDYKCKGVGTLKRVRDSPSPLALSNQESRGCDYNGKGGGVLKRECDSSSTLSCSKQQLLQCDSQLKDGSLFSEDIPCTPKKYMFDPFAPGPKKLNLAPYQKKYTEKSKGAVVRKLEFDLSTKLAPNTEALPVADDEIIFQSVYSDILEVIISTQAEDNGKDSCDLPLSDGFQTPIASRRSGVADTCPGAPVRNTRPRKFRRINERVFRKLEF